MQTQVKPFLNSFQGVFGSAIHFNVSCFKKKRYSLGNVLDLYTLYYFFLEMSAAWLSTSNSRFCHVMWKSEFVM